MADPQIARRSPFVVSEMPGERWWCACGRSKGQPYCDDSHEGTGFVPIQANVVKAGKVAWCGCKRSGNKPYCDGTHSKLS